MTAYYRAKARKTFCLSLSQALASGQFLKKRSLQDLTEIVEFLEQIERSHHVIQQIAIFIHSLVKSINELRLYQIVSIRFDLAGRYIW